MAATTTKHQHRFPSINTGTIATAVAMTIFFSSLVSVLSAVTVDPVQQAIEVGEDAEFVCTRSDKGSTADIVWTFSKDGVVITDNTSGQQQQSSQQTANVNGTLTIRNATENDKGKYVCSLADPGKESEKGDVELVVYVMPDYLEELTGVAVGCAVLMVVLILLQLHKHKKTTKRHHKDSAGNTKTTSKTPYNTQASTSSQMNIFTVEKEGKAECEF